MIRRALLLCGVLVCLIADPVAARTYKIAAVSWAGWSPCHVAEAKGFWSEAGVDVSVITVPDPKAAADLFKQRLVHIAFTMIGSAVGLRMDGPAVRIIAETNWSHGGDKLIARPGFDVARIEDRLVGVFSNSPAITFLLHRYLTGIGRAVDDARIIEMAPGDLADRFVDGQLDLIVSYDPAALRAVREGDGRVVATSAAYPGILPEGMIVLDEVLADIPEADLAAIFRGWIRAVGWSRDPAHWDEYVEILNTRTFPDSPPYTEADLRTMLEAVRIHDAGDLMMRNRSGGGLSVYLKRLKAFLTETGRLRKDFQPEDLMRTETLLSILAADDGDKTPGIAPAGSIP